MMMEIGLNDFVICAGCNTEIKNPSEGRLLMAGPNGCIFVAMCNKCIEKSAQKDVSIWFNQFFRSVKE